MKTILTLLRPYLLASIPLALGLGMAMNPEFTRDRPYADPEVQEYGSDARIAKTIQSSLAEDVTLSPEAKNIKVIATDGSVILRGNVASDEERSKIEALAKKFATTGLVENNLKIQRQ